MKPEEMSQRDRYLKIESLLSFLEDEVRHATNTARIITDWPEVPYPLWREAADELPKAIRKIEKRLTEVKRLWNGKEQSE